MENSSNLKKNKSLELNEILDLIDFQKDIVKTLDDMNDFMSKPYIFKSDKD